MKKSPAVNDRFMRSETLSHRGTENQGITFASLETTVLLTVGYIVANELKYHASCLVICRLRFKTDRFLLQGQRHAIKILATNSLKRCWQLLMMTSVPDKNSSPEGCIRGNM